MLKDIRNLRNGAVYGVTLIVPGISATIFAIILGFYDELINAMNHFREAPRKNIRYLAVFLLGIVVGSVLFSSLIMFLLENHSFPTMLFFMGLLAGTVPLIASKAKGSATRFPKREVALAVFSSVALYALSRLAAATVINPVDAMSNMTAGLVFLIILAGIINGATLVIPGLSGALILLIMGLYPLVISSISSVGDLVMDIGNLSLLRDVAIVLLPYGVGAVAGCLGMARVMGKLMRDHNQSVHAVILGFVIGSVLALVRDPLVYQSGTPVLAVIAGAVMFCAGCAAAFVLGKKH